MAKISCMLAFLLICLTQFVVPRPQVDWDTQFDAQGGDQGGQQQWDAQGGLQQWDPQSGLQQQQQRPQQQGTTTTTPSPQFRSCRANCPVLPQYDPQCGLVVRTNLRQLFNNLQEMKCFQRCGEDVRFIHVGNCRPTAGGK